MTIWSYIRATWSEIPSLGTVGKGILLCVCQLSNFSLPLNMHSSVEPSKIQKKDNIVWEQSSEAILGHFFRMGRAHHGPCVNTVLFVWNLVTPGGWQSWQSLSLQQCHWRMHLVQVWGFRHSELQSAVCFRAWSRPSQWMEERCPLFRSMAGPRAAKPPPVHCLRKQLSSLPHASTWPRNGRT